MDENERAILQTWQINAEAWTHALQQEKIASRKLVTNQAIVEAVLSYHPEHALDLGCGEGWLARRLSERGVAVTGIDAIPDLIEKARGLGGGTFEVCSYQTLAGGQWQAGRRFDAVICNFSLLGHDSVEGLIRSVPKLLTAQGRIFVQTLHPFTACGDLPYVEGWRAGSWKGFGPEFLQPAPWYFRTLAAWVKLFSESGLHLAACLEPLHPQTQRPASIIFVCQTQYHGQHLEHSRL